MAKIRFEDPKVTKQSEELRAQWQALRGDDHDDAVEGQRVIVRELMKLRGWDWEQAIEWIAQA